jgi:hypothetical protein
LTLGLTRSSLVDVRSLPLDPNALDAAAAAAGIDTVQELAARTGINAWTLYNARKRGRIQPSHALRIAEILDVEREQFCRLPTPIAAERLA